MRVSPSCISTRSWFLYYNQVDSSASLEYASMLSNQSRHRFPVICVVTGAGNLFLLDRVIIK